MLKEFTPNARIHHGPCWMDVARDHHGLLAVYPPVRTLSSLVPYASDLKIELSATANDRPIHGTISFRSLFADKSRVIHFLCKGFFELVSDPWSIIPISDGVPF